MSIKKEVDYIKNKNKFVLSCQHMLILPLKRALRETEYSLQYHIEQLNKQGFNYTYFGLVSTLRLNSSYVRTFEYFYPLYVYFSLQFPSVEYLQECEQLEKQFISTYKKIDGTILQKKFRPDDSKTLSPRRKIA